MVSIWVIWTISYDKIGFFDNVKKVHFLHCLNMLTFNIVRI